jgi:hypothetical protein
MTSGRITYRERERRDLVFVQDVAPRRSPLSAPEGDALGYVGYFAELLDECAPDNDANEPLYRLGDSVIDAMAAGVAIEPLARYFEYWLLRLQGVYEPDPRASDEARGFLATARISSPMTIGKARVSAKVLRELEQRHQEQIRAHLEKDLKSARVLREITRR